ncbi:uncharacterized protein K02A2.6 [Trichonephila inaurata madagascariensis]|uniref:RNA-directed DNA polymerase n=1 Tax=Trichonephila inaurata madagascariensis TaxID=2747483 RepID=A0A8X6XIE7_9ARAC|nr:uncharacterized protein K02A2.6 [Trichonephila inaurata madagascariensis]
MELGDRRPSDLLRQMKSLAGSSISDELIKSLWLQRLPQQTQAILSISKDSLNNIAEMAAKIMAVYSSSEDAGIVIKIEKCQFLQTEVDLLDHHISVNGIDPSKERIKVIEDFKLPETVKELRRYLGVINFYHRFIPNTAENQAVLNNYLKGKKKAFRRIVFNNIRNLAHPGIRTTTKWVTSKFVWPSINKDARAWARSCIKCQKSKVTRHVQSPFQQYHNVTNRFTKINLDIIGPLPSSEGFRFCLTIKDQYSRWMEAFPMPDI